MRCNAVIFDLDGTLVDSLEDIAMSANRVLSESGFPTHETDTYRSLVGEGARRLIEKALPASAREQVDDSLRRFREVYSENLLENTFPYEGIAELLQHLSGAGIRLAVLSNKPHDLTETMVARLFGRFEFSPVLGLRPKMPRKPDPASALEIAMRLNVSPNRCAFVGDSPYDMEAARRARMFPLGALWGFYDEESLRDAGAAVLAQSPEDIQKSLLD